MSIFVITAFLEALQVAVSSIEIMHIGAAQAERADKHAHTVCAESLAILSFPWLLLGFSDLSR